MRALLLSLAVVAVVAVALVALRVFSGGPSALNERISAAFRRAPKPGRDTGPRHYYQPYWKA